MNAPADGSAGDTFLDGGGETAEIIRQFPWHSTSLGPIAAWPAGLKTTIGMILRAPVPIVTLWHADGFMIYNDAYSVFAGGRHPVLLGSKVREGWPEVADFNDNVMKVVMAGGTLSYADQELTLHRSGRPEQVWMNLDYSPVRVDDEGIAGVIAFVVETTEKIHAERALRESESKFRAFAQAMPHQVWTATALGERDWFNERACEYSGVAEQALTGAAWSGFVYPGDLNEADRQWQLALAVGAVYETELRIRRADGAYRWHLARALPMRDEAGSIVRWIGTHTDIEEHKRTALALEQLAANLEQRVGQRTAERDRIWRLSRDIMLVATLDGQVASVNPAFSTLLGWNEADVAGTSFLQLVHPDDLQDTLRQMAALRQGASVFRFENRYRGRNGSYCSLSWTAAPDADFIYAVGRDITADLARAETMRRTEAALQQAQKMETIGKLTGGVAHDFNNLLQVISGNLQLIAGEVTGNARVQRRLDNALAGVERGAKLAGYLLAFGRRQALEPKVVKAGRLVAAMEDMLRRSLGEEIEIEMVISGGLWNTAIDVVQLENAVLNLAINARDAMDGRGRLTIEVGNALLDNEYTLQHPDVEAGQYVLVAVSDTGSGMPAEVMHQAFEPFFSTKPEGKGTGLGLSMVYGFVKQSGGHVKIYSEVGEGTTIKLYLPRSHESEDALVRLDAQAAAGGNETILVAEDDEQVRTIVVDMLSELGYRVLKASDAAGALTVIDSGMPIDLLFTDVVMPGPLRSPDLARKARERLPDIAVLFTSGYTENAIVHGGRLDAGVELLGKPYTKEALARKVRQVLGARAASAAALAAVPVAPAPSVTGSIPPVSLPSGAPAGTPLSIVLVDDDADIRAITAELLELLGHQVAQAGDAEAALALLTPATRLLLTDLQLPGVRGDELARRAAALFPRLPVVFITGYGQGAGLVDVPVLAKPFGLTELQRMLATLSA